jgi:hypothetical protein
MAVTSSNFNNIARAISAYEQAGRADAALLTSTALVGSDARINDSGENYTGTLRWLDFSDPTTFHKQDETAANTNLNEMAVSNKSAVYIKNIDHIAAQEMSIQKLISKVDGLAYLGSQFASVRARREDLQLRSILNGVADKIFGATSIGTNDAPTKVGTFGFYTGSNASDAPNPLFANSTGASQSRSTFFDTLLDAITEIKGEFEEPFYYLVVTTATYNIMRKENVLDVAPVVDGNFNFSTILGGKIRLIINNQSLTANLPTSIKVSFLAKAGSVHYSDIAQVNPTAIERNELAGNGGGLVTVLSRWGNIMHPKGFTWAGSATAYPANADLATAASWTVHATNVNQIGLFPIYHG